MSKKVIDLNNYQYPEGALVEVPAALLIQLGVFLQKVASDGTVKETVVSQAVTDGGKLAKRAVRVVERFSEDATSAIQFFNALNGIHTKNAEEGKLIDLTAPVSPTTTDLTKIEG